MFFISLLKKNIFFLKKYIFELYIDFYNSKFLKKLKNFYLKSKISSIKTILNIKLNENFIR